MKVEKNGSVTLW